MSRPAPKQSDPQVKESATKKQRKRGQGEGSIYKRADGRWAAAINLGYQEGKLKRKTFYGETREEVRTKLVAALSDQQKGLPVITERQTLKQFLDRWLEDYVRPSLRPSTYVSYEMQIRLHIIPLLGKVELSKLTPQHIQKYMKDKMQQGLSARTVGYHRRLLVIALGQALKWNLVARNVATLTDPPRTEKFEIEPITPEQAKAFLRAVEGNRLEAFFTVALTLGLRRGEALGLRWTDIDFEAQTLRINQQLQRQQGKLQFSEPKTKTSRRILDLPSLLVSKLKEHRTRQLEDKLRAGSHWQETGLVFTTSVGTPIEPRNVKRSLDALLKNAKLPHYRVHDLRHFAASLMLAQGIQLKVVSDILGHSQISTTADLYTHVLPSLRKEAINLMDSLLTGTK